MQIHESAENYLEAIIKLEQKNGNVRSIDIAHELGYTKPSISRAMSRLKESGHITMDRFGRIAMTESGRALAQQTWDRHKLLTGCLIALGVSPETAAEDACRIEHDISPETYEKIKAYYEKKRIE